MKDNNQGWVSLHRKLLDNPIASNPKYLSVWIHLLLMANHKDNIFLFNNQEIQVRRGQILTGRKKLATNSGVAEGTVETILKFFENCQQIQQQKTNKYRLITIVKYDEYQEFQQQNDNRITTKRQQNDTNNNVNKDNNISKDIGTKVPSFSNENIEALVKGIKLVLGYELDWDRKLLWNICSLSEKFNKDGEVKAGREWLSDNWKINANNFLKAYKTHKADKGFGAESTRTLYQNFKLWFNNKGKFPNS